MNTELSVTIGAINPNSSIAHGRALRSVLGSGYRDLVREAKDTNPQHLDDSLLRGFSAAYELPHDMDSRTFFNSIATKSDYVMNSIVSQLFPDNGKLIRPRAETLEALKLSPSNGFSNEFEQNRRLVLMHAIAQHELRDIKFNFDDKQRELNYFMSNRLCDPESRSEVTFYSEHDPQTNKTLSLSSESNHQSSSKTHHYEIYEVPGIGFVAQWNRKKGLMATVLKSAEKSMNPQNEDYNSGIVNVNLQVRDPLGGLVLVDKNDNLKLVMEKAKVDLYGFYNDRVDRIEEDHKTDTTRGSAHEHIDFLRLQIYLKEMKAQNPDEKDLPIEIIFDSIEKYTDRILHIGERDSKTGLYTGPAQDMYELRRIGNTVSAFIPQDLQELSLSELPLVAEIRAEDLRNSPGLIRPPYCNLYK